MNKPKLLAVSVLRCAAIWLALVICSVHAKADTTYVYTGSPYRFNSDPSIFGLNMTGSVTFNFNTTGVSGSFGINDVTSIELTSGIYTVSGNAHHIPGTGLIRNLGFSLSNGQITNWDIAAGVFFSCFSALLNQGGACGMFSDNGGLVGDLV
jgi:hypothetical protein